MNNQTSAVLPINLDSHLEVKNQGYLNSPVKLTNDVQTSSSMSHLSTVTFTHFLTLTSRKRDQHTGAYIYIPLRFNFVMLKNYILAICLDCGTEADACNDLKFYKLCTVLDSDFEELNQIAGLVVHHDTVVALFKSCPLPDNDIWEGLSEFVISYVFTPEILGDIAGIWMINNFVMSSYPTTSTISNDHSCNYYHC